MKIGIIIYSRTGNTRAAAVRLKEKLSAAGHDAAIEEIEAERTPAPGDKNIRLKKAPDVSPYQGVIFASPVQAFALNRAMKYYLNQVGSLENKKAACFVTKQLAGVWTGGTGAVKHMKKAAEARGAEMLESGIIIWSSKNRDQMIEETTDKISRAF